MTAAALRDQLLAAAVAVPADPRPRAALADWAEGQGGAAGASYAAFVRTGLQKPFPDPAAGVTLAPNQLLALEADWLALLGVGPGRAAGWAWGWRHGLPVVLDAPAVTWGRDGVALTGRPFPRRVMFTDLPGNAWTPWPPHTGCPQQGFYDHARRLLMPRDGPWADEPHHPVYLSLRYDKTGVLLRGPTGSWNGYVVVPPAHPWDRRRPVGGLRGVPAGIGLDYDGTADCCRTHTPGTPDGGRVIGFACIRPWDVQPLSGMHAGWMQAQRTGQDRDDLGPATNRAEWRTVGWVADAVRAVGAAIDRATRFPAGGNPLTPTDPAPLGDRP